SLVPASSPTRRSSDLRSPTALATASGSCAGSMIRHSWPSPTIHTLLSTSHVPPSRENVPEVSRCSTVVSSPPGGTPAGFCSVLISVLLVREGLSWLRSAPWGVSVPECPDQVPVSVVLCQASHGGQLMGSAL